MRHDELAILLAATISGSALQAQAPAAAGVARDEIVVLGRWDDPIGVSRSAFYAWREREPSQREDRDAELTPLVRAIFWKHRRRYGARRIAQELADLGERCCPRHVARRDWRRCRHA